MKFTLAIASTLFATAITAAPRIQKTRQVIFPDITVSVINDQTGLSAAVTVPSDGTVFPIPMLFGGTALDNNGNILASSAQLVTFVENVFCSFNKGDLIIPINGKDKTFADLDGNKDAATPILLNEFTFQCQV
ncbi:uncharacterized protein BDR25DRAFT_301068 [Lindgomyces ingoldianus]|uniref:Uncharacterized protein n=1 Tax=Lindgomyces ingoldianus TaxID=673940 RepID=A0ACB6RAK0_9PLEO|nr:uncharacterized protein BDR25DRAFT_301068 [Lindgomyces ingoldianus]KAF2475357.1 hypothetical protein BDR25DRAFT_301068 [Lindgomyces ingoldianus]